MLQEVVVMALCKKLLLLLLTLTALGQSAPTVAADNVAVQWNLLVSQFVLAELCLLLISHSKRIIKSTPSLIHSSKHWISPIRRKSSQSLGEAVALDVVARRAKDPRRTFTYGATREAVDERKNDPTPGLYRFLNYKANKTLIIQRAALGQTFVLPNALAYIEENLQHFKPPKVPSPEWDVEYEQLVNIGRDNWKGRTLEMNHTAGFIFRSQQKGSLCRSPVDFWFAIARTALPPKTSLYDTALLFSKLGVAIHDSRIVLSALQYGFWFWRPPTAFRAGDANHKPIPDWNQWALWNTHPEYPSGATTISCSAGAVMEAYFGKKKVSFTIQGTYPGPACKAANLG